MMIALLDPGLSSTRGHHFDLDLRLARALASRGHGVVVHGHVDPSPVLQSMAAVAGLALRQTFRVLPYGQLGDPATAMTAYQQMEDATAEDLTQVPAADVWVWPTMSPFQLAAAVSNAGTVRQIGGLWWTPRFPHFVGARSWARNAQRVLQENKPITLGAYDPALCRAYQTFSPGLDVVQLPCPHDGAPNERSPSVLRRIGFFGHQRPGRGLALMPQLVSALVSRGFEVVVQDSSNSIQQWRKHRSVEVLKFIPDFAAEIARCDLVIWPSRWESYMESTSGVLSECVATGVPVIAPSGCLPAEGLARLGCGTFFHEFSLPGILDAVDEAALDFPALVARARAGALLWHAGNGTDRLAAWIETHAGGNA